MKFIPLLFSAILFLIAGEGAFAGDSNLVMPDKRLLLCCPGTEGVKTDVPNIGQSIYYCVAYKDGRRVKHGNYHVFEKGFAVTEKVYFDDKPKSGIKPFNTCKGFLGNAGRSGGLKLKGKPMGKPNGSKSSLPKKEKIGLGPQVSLSNGSTNSNSSPTTKTETVQSNIANLPVDNETCPITPELEKKMEARIAALSQHTKHYPICKVNNPVGLAFMEKMEYVEQKVMEMGMKSNPCYATYFQLRKYDTMITWEYVRLRYCHAERANWPIEYRPKKSVSFALKYGPYDPLGVKPPLEKVAPDLYKKQRAGEAYMKSLGKLEIPEEVTNGFNRRKNSIERILLKDSKVKSYNDKIISLMP